MPNNSTDNLEELISSIGQDKCCAFLGSGLSLDARYPSWEGIKTYLLEKTMAYKGVKIHDIPDDYSGQTIENCRLCLGEDKYWGLIHSLFAQDDKVRYLPNHVALCSIPFLSIITTNYDYCLENAAQIITPNPWSVQYYPYLDITKIRYKYIVHIHGAMIPNDPDISLRTLILSKRDYDSAYHNDTLLPRFLADVYEACTLVFIGFSMKDENLSRVLNFIKQEIMKRREFEYEKGLRPRKQPVHYIIMREDGDVNMDVAQDLNIFPIYYKGENHSQLQPLLETIRSRTTGIELPELPIDSDMFEV